MQALEKDQFLKFHVYDRAKYNCPSQAGAKRTVVINGERVGQAHIMTGSSEVEWLCPYFDPTTHTLRLKQRDGNDHPKSWSIYNMASHSGLRPLLFLAKAEGLLEVIPGMYQIRLSINTGRYISFAIRRIPVIPQSSRKPG